MVRTNHGKTIEEHFSWLQVNSYLWLCRRHSRINENRLLHNHEGRGITLSEAVAAQLLIIIFRPVPGQERDNALYFAGKKPLLLLIRPVNSTGKSRPFIKREKMSRMRASVRSLQRPRAAETVVDDILNVLNELERQRKPTKENDFPVPWLSRDHNILLLRLREGNCPTYLRIILSIQVKITLRL